MEFDPKIVETITRALQISADVLARYEIRYALIGGVAVSYRSQPRFTKDLNFLLKIPQLVLPRVLEDLQTSGFTVDVIATIKEWTQHHMIALRYEGVRVDWLKPVVPTYDHIIEKATDERIAARSVRVATLESLIVLKLLAFRPQDLFDIENLIAAADGKLDADWIRGEWKSLFSLEDRRMKWFEAALAG